MSNLLLADEIALRFEKSLGERTAQEMKCAIQDGRAEKGVIRHFGHTIAIKNPDSPRQNQVFCFTHKDLEHLPNILAFYEGQEPQPAFYLSSLGFSGILGKTLALAGFYQARFTQVVLYGKPETKSPQLPQGITVERVAEEDIEIYLETMAQGFDWHPDWKEDVKETERRKLQSPDYHPFLTRYEGELAGTGNFTVEGEIGRLDGGAVIPRFRKRGCHTALLYKRLYAAHKLGCSIIVSGATYGSTSFRNQQRAGLQIAYIESNWKKL